MGLEAPLFSMEVQTKKLSWGAYCLIGERKKKDTLKITFFFFKKREIGLALLYGALLYGELMGNTDCGVPGSLSAAPGYTKYRYISNLMCHNCYC